MNKYSLLMSMVLFLVFSTIMASSLTGFEATSDITTGLEVGEVNFLTIVSTVWNSLGFFFSILTFQVEGVPVLINLLVFWPLSVGIFFMIISIIRGTD